MGKSRPATRPPKEEFERLNATIPGPELATHYAVSLDTIKEWRRIYNIVKRPANHPKETFEIGPERARELWATHGSIHAIGRALGISRSAVRRILRDAGIDADKPTTTTKRPAKRPAKLGGRVRLADLPAEGQGVVKGRVEGFKAHIERRKWERIL